MRGWHDDDAPFTRGERLFLIGFGAWMLGGGLLILLGRRLLGG
jgi:hypothetical protein